MISGLHQYQDLGIDIILQFHKILPLKKIEQRLQDFLSPLFYIYVNLELFQCKSIRSLKI